jgi:hypothetical protein
MKPQLLSDLPGNELRVYREFSRGGVWAQPKLDGIRCIVADGAAWGRSGPVPLRTLAPIIWEGLQALLGGSPLGVDGELHAEGVSPAEMGRAIQSGEAVAGLRFAAFDLVSDGLFADRFATLQQALKSPPDCVSIVDTQRVRSKAEIDELMAATRATGGEGLVIRLNAPYAQGQRQRHAFKLKAWENGHGRVIGLREQSVQIQPENAPAFWVKAAFEFIQSTRIGDRADFRFCGRASAGTPLNAALYW